MFEHGSDRKLVRGMEKSVAQPELTLCLLAKRDARP
jgi:hypothetical protein